MNVNILRVFDELELVMEKTKSLSEIRSDKNQEELRKKLLESLQKNPMGVGGLAKNIGISWATLNSFLNDGKPASLKVLLKISNHLKEHDK